MSATRAKDDSGSTRNNDSKLFMSSSGWDSQDVKNMTPANHPISKDSAWILYGFGLDSGMDAECFCQFCKDSVMDFVMDAVPDSVMDMDSVSGFCKGFCNQFCWNSVMDSAMDSVMDSVGIL